MKNKYFCIMFYLHDYQFNERESDCLIVIGLTISQTEAHVSVILQARVPRINV